MIQDSKIYIAGHKGMVGSAVKKKLESAGFYNLIWKDRSELDLRIQPDVFDFIADEKPDVIIDAAARVGGILANNQYPYRFIYENLSIQNNLIHAAHLNDVMKFVFLGSSCIYPKFTNQPIREESLLTGKLEPTNQWYALAKISGVKMVEALRKEFNREYVSLMPANLYGPNDNFDLHTSHVLPALIRKFHEAKEDGHRSVTLWGSGTPKREFLHVNDVADAVYFAIQHSLPESLYNVGTGKELSIKQLALKIQQITGHRGEIQWDSNKPDGTPRKVLDTTKMNRAGWFPSISLEEGLKTTYNWYLKNQHAIRKVEIN